MKNTTNDYGEQYQVVNSKQDLPYTHKSKNPCSPIFTINGNNVWSYFLFFMVPRHMYVPGPLYIIRGIIIRVCLFALCMTFQSSLTHAYCCSMTYTSSLYQVCRGQKERVRCVFQCINAYFDGTAGGAPRTPARGALRASRPGRLIICLALLYHRTAAAKRNNV